MPPSTRGELGTQDDVILARAGAFVVDHVISIVLASALGIATIVTVESMALTYVAILAGLLGYFIVLEGLTGQTIGKALFGLVVVTIDGDPITFRHSVIRNVLRLIDSVMNYAVALVVMLTNEDRQRIGDMAAGTIVVAAAPREPHQ